MAGTTISNAQTIGVRLTTSSQNPVTLTGSGSITMPPSVSPLMYAVYGSAAYSWTIGISGLLNGTYGITLAGGGSVANNGRIGGIVSGVIIAGPGVVTNYASISGGNGNVPTSGARGGFAIWRHC